MTCNLQAYLRSNRQKPLLVGTVHSAACLNGLAQGSENFFKKNNFKKIDLEKSDFQIDFLEARLDSLPEKLLPTSWPLPVIATARHPSEGGKKNLTLAQRRDLLEKALPWASAVDVELRSVKELASTIAHARNMKRLLIFSLHDFKTVPSLARLEKMAQRAQDEGADFFKVACNVRSDQELMRLVVFQSMMQSRLSHLPVATMGMGERGQLSRLLLPAYGSALCYGWLCSPQLPGQWSVQELAKLFSSLSLPSLRKRLAARTGVEPVRQP